MDGSSLSNVCRERPRPRSDVASFERLGDGADGVGIGLDGSMLGFIAGGGWRAGRVLVMAVWRSRASVVLSVSIGAWWRSNSMRSCACSVGSDCSLAVDVVVGDISIGVVLTSLGCKVWSLQVFEADISWTSWLCCWRGVGQGDVFCMAVSFMVLSAEVGDPLRLF